MKVKRRSSNFWLRAACRPEKKMTLYFPKEKKRCKVSHQFSPLLNEWLVGTSFTVVSQPFLTEPKVKTTFMSRSTLLVTIKEMFRHPFCLFSALFCGLMKVTKTRIKRYHQHLPPNKIHALQWLTFKTKLNAFLQRNDSLCNNLN